MRDMKLENLSKEELMEEINHLKNELDVLNVRNKTLSNLISTLEERLKCIEKLSKL